MVASSDLGETLNIGERWRLWKRVRSNWSSDFLKKICPVSKLLL